jgi:hypothetical protein
VFLPFASSPNSIRWAAREGVTAILPPMHEVYESPLFDLYAEVSGKPRGQGTGLLRDVIIADTDEEAMALWEDSGRFSGTAWFEPFGFRRGLMDPVTKKFATAKESIDLGYALVGTACSRRRRRSSGSASVLACAWYSPMSRRGWRCRNGPLMRVPLAARRGDTGVRGAQPSFPNVKALPLLSRPSSGVAADHGRNKHD